MFQSSSLCLIFFPKFKTASQLCLFHLDKQKKLSSFTILTSQLRVSNKNKNKILAKCCDSFIRIVPRYELKHMCLSLVQVPTIRTPFCWKGLLLCLLHTFACHLCFFYLCSLIHIQLRIVQISFCFDSIPQSCSNSIILTMVFCYCYEYTLYICIIYDLRLIFKKCQQLSSTVFSFQVPLSIIASYPVSYSTVFVSFCVFFSLVKELFHSICMLVLKSKI